MRLIFDAGNIRKSYDAIDAGADTNLERVRYLASQGLSVLGVTPTVPSVSLKEQNVDILVSKLSSSVHRLSSPDIYLDFQFDGANPTYSDSVKRLKDAMPQSYYHITETAEGILYAAGCFRQLGFSISQLSLLTEKEFMTSTGLLYHEMANRAKDGDAHIERTFELVAPVVNDRRHVDHYTVWKTGNSEVWMPNSESPLFMDQNDGIREKFKGTFGGLVTSSMLSRLSQYTPTSIIARQMF